MAITIQGGEQGYSIENAEGEKFYFSTKEEALALLIKKTEADLKQIEEIIEQMDKEEKERIREEKKITLKKVYKDMEKIADKFFKNQ